MGRGLTLIGPGKSGSLSSAGAVAATRDEGGGKKEDKAWRSFMAASSVGSGRRDGGDYTADTGCGERISETDAIRPRFWKC